jgi:hypothetical protein
MCCRRHAGADASAYQIFTLQLLVFLTFHRSVLLESSLTPSTLLGQHSSCVYVLPQDMLVLTHQLAKISTRLQLTMN